MHRLIPLRSNLPLELYIGNNENYAPRATWPPKITKERELSRYFRLGETAFMDEVDRLRQRWPEPTYRLLLTGPWPPYRFAGLQRDAV